MWNRSEQPRQHGALTGIRSSVGAGWETRHVACQLVTSAVGVLEGVVLWDGMAREGSAGKVVLGGRP